MYHQFDQILEGQCGLVVKFLDSQTKGRGIKHWQDWNLGMFANARALEMVSDWMPTIQHVIIDDICWTFSLLTLTNSCLLQRLCQPSLMFVADVVEFWSPEHCKVHPIWWNCHNLFHQTRIRFFSAGAMSACLTALGVSCFLRYVGTGTTSLIRY